jgi:hypothetical protein
MIRVALSGFERHILIFGSPLYAECTNRRFFAVSGGDPAFAWPLPLWAYDTLDGLVYERGQEAFDEVFGSRKGISSEVQIGTCPGWAFAIQTFFRDGFTRSLVDEISGGTTAVSVDWISAKALVNLAWAEDNELKGEGEAAGPFIPALEALIKQADVDNENNLGKTLFAPVLSAVWGIHLSQEDIGKPLLTGPFLFPPVHKP